MHPRLLLFVLSIIGVSGCVGPGKLATESGKPEVIITNAEVAEVAKILRTSAPTKGQIYRC